MKYLSILFIPFLAFLVGIEACKRPAQINSTGGGSEILVVCSQSQWESALGDSIRHLFSSPMEGLPEPEPSFTLVYVPLSAFSKVLESHRNLLFIEPARKLKYQKVETMQDVWSRPQRVVRIRANSDTAAIRMINRHGKGVMELFNQSERARYRSLVKGNNAEAEKYLKENLGVSLTIPSDYYLASKTEDFVWPRNETMTMGMGLLIYTIPYFDTVQMQTQSILSVRDNFTKKYVPGPLQGSYMVHESLHYIPHSKRILLRDKIVIETRGLRKTEGDFMGGPFVNFSFVDAPRQRIVVIDGYVYNPNKPKRDYIRQLEASILEAEIGNPIKK